MARLVAGSSLEGGVGSLCIIHGDAIVNMRLGERGLESTARGHPNKKQDEDVHGPRPEVGQSSRLLGQAYANEQAWFKY